MKVISTKDAINLLKDVAAKNEKEVKTLISKVKNGTTETVNASIEEAIIYISTAKTIVFSDMGAFGSLNIYGKNIPDIFSIKIENDEEVITILFPII